MSLWDHIHPKTLEEMAEMLRPPPEYRLVSKTYSLAIASKQHIYDISSKRRLDSLIPFAEPIRKLSKDRFRDMEIVTSPSEGVIGIYIRDFESGKSFSLPAEVLNQVATEVAESDRMRPEAGPSPVS